MSILALAEASSEAQCRKSLFQLAGSYYRTFDLTSYVETTFGPVSSGGCDATAKTRSSSGENYLYSDRDGNVVIRSRKDTEHIYLTREDKYFKLLRASPDIRFAAGKDVIFALNNEELFCIEPAAPKVFRKDSIGMKLIGHAGKGVRSIAVDDRSGDVLLATSSGDGIVRVKLMVRTTNSPCARLPDLQMEDYKYRLRTVLDSGLQRYRGIAAAPETRDCVDMSRVMSSAFSDCTELYGQHIYNESSLNDYGYTANHTDTNDREIQTNNTIIGGVPSEPSIPSVDKIPGHSGVGDSFAIDAVKASEIIVNAKNILQSLVDGTDLIGPFFENYTWPRVILARDIKEGERGLFYCMEKNKSKSLRRHISGAEQQYNTLMQGLSILRSGLDSIDESDMVTPKNDDTMSIDIRFGS